VSVEVADVGYGFCPRIYSSLKAQRVGSHGRVAEEMSVDSDETTTPMKQHMPP
jgi:hypothetical protein